MITYNIMIRVGLYIFKKTVDKKRILKIRPLRGAENRNHTII